MVKVKFDVSGSDPEAARTVLAEPPKPGVYGAKLVQCKPGFKADDDGNPMKDRPRLEVVYEITDKDAKSPEGKSAKGAWLFAYYTFDDHEISQRKLDQFYQAFGIATSTKRKGTFDTDDILGHPCKIRVRGDTWNDQYSPKVVAVIAGDAADTSDDEPLEGDDEDLGEDIDTLGAEADEGEQTAIDRLEELAEENGLDPNEYELWADLATAIVEAQGGGGEEEEPDEEEEEEEEEEEPDLEALGEAADAGDDDAQAALNEFAEAAELDPDEYDTWAGLAAALGGNGASEAYEGWNRADLVKEAKSRNLTVVKSDTVDSLRNKLLEDDGADPF